VKPLKPLDVSHDDFAVVFEGRAVVDYNATWSPEDVMLFRKGYACLECWERQEAAFPKSCGLCGYPMKERQAEDFAQSFRGEKRLGPNSVIHDEIERLKEQRDRRLYLPGSSIAVPRVVASAKTRRREV
jgi:hypothetical protein